MFHSRYLGPCLFILMVVSGQAYSGPFDLAGYCFAALRPGFGLKFLPTGSTVLEALEPTRGSRLVDGINGYNNNEEEVYALGRGVGTGIYRVIAHRGSESFIRKFYPSQEKMLLELQGYGRLSALFAKSARPPFEVVSAALAGSVDSSSLELRLSDVYGRSLQEVLKDDRIDPNLRDSLNRNFLDRLDSLDALLRKAGISRVGQLGPDDDPGYSYSDPDRPGYLLFSIRTSQVVVTFKPLKNGKYSTQMTIVDPY